MTEQTAPSRPGRWYKGMPSPNAKGRPRTGYALAEVIREQLEGNDRELLRRMIRIAIQVALGQPVCVDLEYQRACAAAEAAGLPPPDAPHEVLAPSLNDIASAREFLSRWGFRAPAQEVEVGPGSAAGPVSFANLDQDDLDRLEAAQAELAAVYAKAAGALPAG